MALSANTLPIVMPSISAPFDVMTAFAKAQTLTATGYVNNLNTQINVGTGRITGFLALDITNLKLSAGNETYQFFLLGSNDASFTSGNIDLLAAHDFAAAASGRLLPTICAASPSVPVTGQSGTRHFIPYSNLMGGYMFQYLQFYTVISGTSPTVTCSAWLTYDTEC